MNIRQFGFLLPFVCRVLFSPVRTLLCYDSGRTLLPSAVVVPACPGGLCVRHKGFQQESPYRSVLQVVSTSASPQPGCWGRGSGNCRLFCLRDQISSRVLLLSRALQISCNPTGSPPARVLPEPFPYRLYHSLCRYIHHPSQ